MKTEFSSIKIKTKKVSPEKHSEILSNLGRYADKKGNLVVVSGRPSTGMRYTYVIGGVKRKIEETLVKKSGLTIKSANSIVQSARLYGSDKKLQAFTYSLFNHVNIGKMSFYEVDSRALFYGEDLFSIKIGRRTNEKQRRGLSITGLSDLAQYQYLSIESGKENLFSTSHVNMADFADIIDKILGLDTVDLRIRDFVNQLIGGNPHVVGNPVPMLKRVLGREVEKGGR
jgi:hypothetical protein